MIVGMPFTLTRRVRPYDCRVDQAAALGATVLSVVMGVAALAKFSDLEGFHRNLLGYIGIPKGATAALARIVPVAEAVVAAGVWFPGLRAAAAVLGLVLLTVFTVLLSLHLARGVDIDCGCFGSKGKQRVTPLAVVRNLLLMGAAALVLIDAGEPGALSGPILTGIGGAALLLVVEYGLAFLSAPDVRR